MPRSATVAVIDSRQFTQLLRRHDERLRGLAFRLLGDRNRMDDVLQDAYLKAYRAYGSFAGRSDPGTWLYRIVYNACVDEIRRADRRPTQPLEERDVSPAAAADERSNDRAVLADALDRLPHDQKAVVWLVDVEGYDYRDAAELLGVAAGTIGSRLSRAHAFLRAELGEER